MIHTPKKCLTCAHGEPTRDTGSIICTKTDTLKTIYGFCDEWEERKAEKNEDPQSIPAQE